MDVVQVAAHDMPERALRSLRLDDVGVDLFSVEALAASLRRAASFLCPATPRTVVRAVEEVLRSIPGFESETSELLDLLVNTLVAYGDLIEMSTTESERVRRLFLAPPGFVRRASGLCVLFGVRPDGLDLVGNALAERIDYEAHARFLPVVDDLDDLLASTDLIERKASQWLRTPRQVSAVELISWFVGRLDAAGPAGDIIGARLLDSSASVTYYRGRWRAPRADDEGCFVARMPQRYGADLWCFAWLEGGQVDRLVALPIRADVGPAADEAWHLQAAIDASEGHPQLVRLRTGPAAGQTVIDLFAPLPSWAQRHLDLVGTPLLRGRGALFSYAVPTLEVVEEIAFLVDMLWMEVQDNSEGAPT